MTGMGPIRINKKWSTLIFMMALCLFCLSIAAYCSGTTVSASDEYDGLRLKLLEQLDGGDVNSSDSDIAAAVTTVTARAQTYWDSLNTATGRTYLWSNLQSVTLSSHITSAYGRLRAMALAYQTKGSSLENDAALAADIVSALDWMYANRYSESTTRYNNWWDWEIGAPLALNDTVVLMYDQLNNTQIANYMKAVNQFSPDPTKLQGNTNATGANRVWKATVVGTRGILIKDSAKIAAARDALTDVFSYSTSGDGFYTDGSFIQHKYFPYTGGYGKDLLSDMASLMYLLDGSTWAVTHVNQQNVFKWVYDSYEPLIYKGAMMDMTRGRVISWGSSSDHKAGHEVMASIVLLSQFAPTTDALAYKQMFKAWMESEAGSGINFYADVPLRSIELGKSIMNDSGITSRSELVMTKIFPAMTQAVHLQPGFGFAVSMHSNKIKNFESINQENLKGWHTSDGMTYLYNDDLEQFGGNFWATVDPYRLPGTTVQSNTSVVSGFSDKNAVGGVSMGSYGTAQMALHPSNSTLSALKSWFMFDNEIVALGSGVTSTGGKAVETIIENRKLTSAGDNVFKVNDETAESTSLALGTQTYAGTNWMNLEGNVPGSEIGYYFPDAPTIKTIRESRTGTWNAINTNNGSTDPKTNSYLTLWLEHGTNPTNSNYAYVLLPNKTSTQTSSYAANPDVEILANTTSVQAVREKQLHVTGANFWTNVTQTVYADSAPYLTSNKIAAVMVHESGNELTVAVSDPTQAYNGSITLEIHQPDFQLLSKDSQITVLQQSPTLKLSINVNAAKGKTFKATFQKSIQPTLKGKWSFNETSGTTAADLSGNGNTATLVNGAAWAPGISFNALELDGIDDYATVADSSTLDGMGSLTVSAWVYLAQLPVQNYVPVGKDSVSSSPSYRIAIGSTGAGHFAIRTTNDAWNATGTKASFGAILALNQWHHIVGTYDGTTVKVYVDGVLQGSGLQPISGSVYNGTSPLRFGYKSATNIDYMKGNVDEVNIYSTALSAAEVLELYQSYTGYTSAKDWNFNTSGSSEGWTAFYQVSMAVSAGAMNLTSSGTDPQVKSPDNLAIDPVNNTKIRIRMKNNTSQTTGGIYFITNSDTTWNAAKKVNFTLVPNSDYTDYVVDMSTNAAWAGTIKQLRLDALNPAAGSGQIVNIDYVRVTD
ncbi:polysaccharide lyase family 8 super-sandwich domain-containing protein [Paenibacillus koleovorans]|uniref:polysaccharide lyase family 8 super-sandwich domain-containing protein n=1 Tax=Paenibacillus koleovorans TaxID=121608 RepID=UPI0013E32C3C|nr:polysaccharide lyase family 8 super-sandwich domain-containing protein [Paenibacillus koleovorans]